MVNCVSCSQWFALLKEFRVAKAVYEEEKANLLAEGVAVADDIKLVS